MGGWYFLTDSPMKFAKAKDHHNRVRFAGTGSACCKLSETDQCSYQSEKAPATFKHMLARW